MGIDTPDSGRRDEVGATKHHNRGVDLGDAGRWEEAIAEFDQAIELEGDPLSQSMR